MENKELESLIALRNDVIGKFESLRSYKNNPNAIMKEIDAAKLLSEVIKKIDAILKNHVQFS